MKLKKLSHNFQAKGTKDPQWEYRIERAISRLREDPAAVQMCLEKVPDRCYAIQHMFSSKNFINKLVLKLQYCKREDLPTDIYNDKYLPFHLRDYDWLAKYLMEIVKHNPEYEIGRCRAIVQAHPFYIESRSRYERDLAGELIYFMMNHQTPNALIDSKDIIYYSKGLVDFDKIFRQHAVNTFQGLGLDSYESEILVELHADKWRSESMSLAFDNQYYYTPETRDLRKTKSWNRWQWFRKAHEKAWVKYREYLYGQEHKKILQKMGLMTGNMTMNHQQVATLRKKLKKFEQVRSRILAHENAKQSNNIERTK